MDGRLLFKQDLADCASTCSSNQEHPAGFWIAVLQEKSSKTFGKGSARKLLIIWKGNSRS